MLYLFCCASVDADLAADLAKTVRETESLAKKSEAVDPTECDLITQATKLGKGGGEMDSLLKRLHEVIKSQHSALVAGGGDGRESSNSAGSDKK